MENEDKIALEMRIQYLEDHILQMDKVILEQSESLERLSKNQKLMQDKMQDLSIQLEQGDLPENEKPPHY